MKSIIRNFLIGAIVLYLGLLIQREGFDDSSKPPSSESPSSPPSEPTVLDYILVILKAVGVALIIGFVLILLAGGGVR